MSALSAQPTLRTTPEIARDPATCRPAVEPRATVNSTRRRPATRRARGFTLLEVLLMVAVVGILATALVPDSAPQDHLTLDLATAEVSTALRFARSLAIRSGTPHGVRFRSNLRKIEVFRLDTSGTPSEVYDVRHPLDRKLYDIDLDSFPYTAGATASADFRYAVAGAPSLAVAFDANGEPIAANDLDPLLENGTVSVTYHGLGRTVSVATVTGRVTTP